VLVCLRGWVGARVHGCGLAVFIDQELCSMVRQQLRSIAAAGAPVSQATLMQKSNSPQPPLHALGVHCYRNGLAGCLCVASRWGVRPPCNLQKKMVWCAPCTIVSRLR
jgi:hypothetical protein